MSMAMLFLVTMLFVCFVSRIEAEDEGFVTCGSVIKLLNTAEGARLHSHDVKYGSGSGQQSVTGMRDSDDVNSHWEIRPALKSTCKRGEPIKCGERIRLKHLTSGCLLHSHHFPAPLSKSHQEVSCFGKDGEGDTGDNWLVICGTDEWFRENPIKLKHEDTGMYLGTSGQEYGRPIAGQKEVAALSAPGTNAMWRSVEGVYMLRQHE